MVIIVMGVSGSGKSTIGTMLAERLGCSFFDGDDYHPPENVAKMAQGQPLTDADRLPWLRRLNDILVDCEKAGAHGVLACSALKKTYRGILSEGLDKACFVHLKGDYETIYGRMTTREGHFMGARMLQSQFDTLEDPEDAMVVDIRRTPEEIVSCIEAQLSSQSGDI